MGSAFGNGSRLGTPPLDLGHAMSLPNPDALRAAGVSPGLGHGRLHAPHSGGLGGAGDNPFAANSRVQALRGMQRHASLEGQLPGGLGAPAGGGGSGGGGGFSSLGIGQRTGSGSLGVLPPGPNPSVFAAQRVGSQPLGSQGLGPGDAQISSPSRPQPGRFSSISGPHPFAAQQNHGHRRSVDMGSMGRSVGPCCLLHAAGNHQCEFCWKVN